MKGPTPEAHGSCSHEADGAWAPCTCQGVGPKGKESEPWKHTGAGPRANTKGLGLKAEKGWAPEADGG